MPALAMYHIAPPTDENEFETILIDYGQTLCGGIASLLGRKGQKQHGIDVVVTKFDGSQICIQCKDYIETTITEHNIDQWVAEAETSPIPFSFFIIATSGRRNAKLQEYVSVKSAERIAEGKWPFTIIFWEDIEHFIKQRPELLRQYYPYLYNGEVALNNMIVNIQNKKQDENIAITKGEAREEDIRIRVEAVLRNKFLEEVVRYRIQEMLRVDPFTGFNFDLVVAADCFEVAIQELIDKAIGLSSSDRYMQIGDFRYAFDAFTGYLSTICQTSYNGNIVKFTNDFDNMQDHLIPVEDLRRKAIGYLNEIQDA